LVGEAELPGGVEELLEGVGFEGAPWLDFSAEAGGEGVEGRLLMGLDEGLAGGERVGDGVAADLPLALRCAGAGGFSRVGRRVARLR
jgi:hypothetical protein